MSTWIDFKSLRAQLSFADVLKHYGVQARIKGERTYALCPLPNHPVHAGGGQRTASLSINLTRNIFQCFGCKASGNVIDFCARMEGFDPSDPKQFRSAALKIAETFGVAIEVKPDAKVKKMPPTDTKSIPAAKPSELSPAAKTLPVIINAPLDFELKHLDPKHPYLASRGFIPETIEHFGLGYCGKGMMKDRIAIPLHDAEGRLIGYAGRIVDDERINDEIPKYLFPGSREREGKQYEFHKSQLLYNLHRLDSRVEELIVVEGFASVWWLHQNGYRNTVALLGSSCSFEQVGLLAKFAKRVWILTDGDDAGRQCVDSIWRQAGSQLHCRCVPLDDGRQPTDLSADELAAVLWTP